jgi:hypothetical protein
MDEGINFEEDNLKIDFDHHLFSIRAFSTQYSFELFSNNSFPTVLNNESIQYFEITSLITNFNEIVNFVNSAPKIESNLPVILDYRDKVLINGRISSLSPINETLEWTFNFLNSSIDYPVSPEAIYSATTGQYILAPGYWNITVQNNQTSVEWTSYIPIWKTNLEFNALVEIQVEGYRFSAQNMTLYLLDNHAYVIDNQYYYYERFSYETITYSRHFIDNNITIDLPNWIVFANYRTNIENITSSYRYNGTTSIEIPSEANITQNFTMEFEIIDYFGYSSSYNQTYIFYIPVISTEISIIDEINITNNYDMILRNRNSAQTLMFQLNSNSLLLDLMVGSWDIEVIMLDLHFNFIEQIEPFINLTLALYNITVFSHNLNFNKFTNYTGNLLVENVKTGDSFYYRYDYTNKLSISNSNYNITIFSEDTLGSKFITINNNHLDVIINFTLIIETGFIKIIGGQGIDPETATITHIATNTIKPITKSTELWLVEDFPVGLVYVSVNQGGFTTEMIGWYEPSFRQLKLYLDDSSQSIVNWDGVGGVIQANDINNVDAASGPLAYTKVIIAAEKLIIILSLIVNISGVYSGLISESRNEIKIARSIGFTEPQVLIGILRDIWYIGLFSTVIGGLIAMSVTSLLFSSDTTILFGHRFVPEFSLILWLVNFVSVYIIAIVGAIIGLKMEA